MHFVRPFSWPKPYIMFINVSNKNVAHRIRLCKMSRFSPRRARKFLQNYMRTGKFCCWSCWQSKFCHNAKSDGYFCLKDLVQLLNTMRIAMTAYYSFNIFWPSHTFLVFALSAVHISSVNKPLMPTTCRNIMFLATLAPNFKKSRCCSKTA